MTTLDMIDSPEYQRRPRHQSNTDGASSERSASPIFELADEKPTDTAAPSQSRIQGYTWPDPVQSEGRNTQLQRRGITELQDRADNGQVRPELSQIIEEQQNGVADDASLSTPTLEDAETLNNQNTSYQSYHYQELPEGNLPAGQGTKDGQRAGQRQASDTGISGWSTPRRSGQG